MHLIKGEQRGLVIWKVEEEGQKERDKEETGKEADEGKEYSGVIRL